MRPKHTLKHLNFIVENQKTVSTSKLQEITKVLSFHQKMLEKDNRRLRRRIKRQRKALRRLENE